MSYALFLFIDFPLTLLVIRIFIVYLYHNCTDTYKNVGIENEKYK